MTWKIDMPSTSWTQHVARYEFIIAREDDGTFAQLNMNIALNIMDAIDTCNELELHCQSGQFSGWRIIQVITFIIG